MHKKIYNFFHRHYHSRYHGFYRHAKKLFVFDLFLLGLAAVMLGSTLFFFFWRPGTTDLIDLTLSIGGARVKSGEQIVLQAEYTNRSKFTLRDATLSLRLPAGFILPKNANTVFKIGEVAPGSKAKIDLPGQLWSDKKTEEKIIATFTYRAGENKYTEQKISTLLLNLPESVLITESQLPEASFADSRLPLAITLTNTGQGKIDNILLSHNWPGNIILNQDVLHLSLAAGESKTIEGRLNTPGKNGPAPLQIITQVVIDGHPLTQSIIEKNINIVAPQFFSQVEFLDAPFATPGQILPVRVSFKNNNDYAVPDLVIRLTPTAGIVDLAATAKNNHLKYIGGSLIIDGKSRTRLANAEAGQSDSFEIKLQLRPHFSLGPGVKELRLEPKVEGQLPQLAEQKFSQIGTADTLPLVTEVTLSVEPRYYTEDGEQLGRGPLPPQAGETTKYWIFIRLTNTVNNIQNASFRAVLPANIEFTTRQSVTIGSPLKFNSSDRSVTWSYPELPAFSETGLYFEVAITPTVGQVGQTIQLVKNLEFSATDKMTGRTFNLSKPGIYNTLNQNDRGAVKGAQVVAGD